MENKTMAVRKTKDTVVRANSKIEYGGEVYTHQSLSDHVIALHEARSISLLEDLNRQFDIGKVFMQIQAKATDWGRTKYSQYLKEYYYSKGITQQQTSEYKFMATNEMKLRKSIKANDMKLGQGCSYYRKELKKLDEPKAKTKAKAKSKSTKTKGKSTSKVTETLLAKSTLALVKEHGLDIHKLVKLLTTKKI
tara:strand:- start:391 stop:969 length:579 start_codon:yes stop_codon:yes gene_type:complete